MRSPSDAEILEHPTSGQAGRYQGSGDASTRMRAGANEIQVVVALMAVSRPKVAQLHHVVTQPMGSASDQVVPLAPRKRRETRLKFFLLMIRRPPKSTLFPYTTLSR